MATSTTYHLMNADCMEHCGVRPSQCARGTVLVVRQPLKACPWLGDQRTIPPGTYKVISRKHFTGGSQEIAPV